MPQRMNEAADAIAPAIIAGLSAIRREVHIFAASVEGDNPDRVFFNARTFRPSDTRDGAEATTAK